MNTPKKHSPLHVAQRQTISKTLIAEITKPWILTNNLRLSRVSKPAAVTISTLLGLHLGQAIIRTNEK